MNLQLKQSFPINKNFSYSNADTGGHYHTASGNNNVKVRGRFGARNPANGRIEETVYTAGPRG